MYVAYVNKINLAIFVHVSTIAKKYRCTLLLAPTSHRSVGFFEELCSLLGSGFRIRAYLYVEFVDSQHVKLIHTLASLNECMNVSRNSFFSS